MDKVGNVVVDIESLTQPSDNCSGSPKVTVSHLYDLSDNSKLLWKQFFDIPVIVRIL